MRDPQVRKEIAIALAVVRTNQRMARRISRIYFKQRNNIMTETRDFPTAVIASISSGILLCKFGEMHEAAEFLMGHPIWTHHFADQQLWAEMNKTIAAQCPGMPSEDDAAHVNKDNWQEFASELEAKIGKTVSIRKGGGLTAMLPTDGWSPGVRRTYRHGP